MNSAATQRAAETREPSIPKKRPVASGGASNVQSKTRLAVHTQPVVWEDKTLELELVERPSSFTLSLPLSGIDPRQVYIQAASNSLLIEFRVKKTMSHNLLEGGFKESIDKRMSVEFTLPLEIEQGATTVGVYGGLLEITARKAPRTEQASWSEIVPFPTRSASH
jgi:HSP20 family molecular chaperone IbpA